MAASSNTQDLVANAVALLHPKDGYEVLMFPDASDNHWGSLFLEGGVEVEKMSHEPLGFLSGTFRGSQQRRATVDKEEFAIVSTFRLLENLLCGGVHIYIDHRNLAYIFESVRFVGAKDGGGAATRKLEDGSRAVRLHDHTYFW